MLRAARFRSLPVILIISSIGLVVLTVLAIGVPAILLNRSRLDEQARMRIEQGVLSTQALLAARVQLLNDLALLITRRPTLSQFAAGDPSTGLQPYLEDLRSGSGLDALALCGPERNVLGHAGLGETAALCAQPAGTHYYVPESTDNPRLWLISVHPLEESSLGMVVCGILLDNSFTTDLFEQTGLQHILVQQGMVVASNFPDRANLESALSAAAPLDELGGQSAGILRITVESEPFYAIRIPLSEPGIEDISALSVAALFETQRQLSLLILEIMLAAVLVGAGLGIWIARRIGRPLSDLRTAAVALRQGELSTPIPVLTAVPEVGIVASALEDSRVALRHTLTELRRERDWVEHLLESIVEGVVTLDLRGRITYFSRGAERISGWAQQDTLGRSCDEIFHPVDGSPFNAFIPQPGSRQKVTVAMGDDRQMTLAITGARLAPPAAGKASMVLVLRDVSEEDAMRRLLGDFLANITHEFRTPLSALAASSELLLDQVRKQSPAALEELLGALHLGILGLQTLIDNLLEGASIETGRFRVFPAPANLNEIVREAAATMQPLILKHRQRLDVSLADEIPLVRVDHRRTVQALVNLLSNAVKFGDPGGVITLVVSGRPEGALVSVCDQGPGIPAERLADLFHRRIPVHTEPEKSQPGAGLGLTVVRTIVEAQGGQVGAENLVSGGARFWLTLPYASPAPGDLEDQQPR